MLAATAKRSDRPKRQLMIDPCTEADNLLPAQKRKLNERRLLTNALTLQTTALLSCPDRQLLGQKRKKPTFNATATVKAVTVNIVVVQQENCYR